MNRSKKVGYTYYGKGSAKHTGITNNPARRRKSVSSRAQRSR